MALVRHFKTYYRQDYGEGPSGANPPFDTVKAPADGTEIRGLFIPDRSTGLTVAEAPGVATKGRFVTAPDSPVATGDMLRSGCRGFFIALTNDPLAAPSFSPTQAKVYLAEVVSRPGTGADDGGA